MNKKTKYNLIGLATAVLLIALDQWTKALAGKASDESAALCDLGRCV